ncbi:zinc finger protein 25 [Microcaecilia unicolor]|uniref:Zinc finger protein 25-like n=1 Tax=Microcaecilia unicolor TaxID=1415580 RepID=A0A6P7WXN6_9AMPH|nr:zinc finger protein 25-like [Microcaecilia unicolor]
MDREGSARVPPSLDNITVNVTPEEWEDLEKWQKALYDEVTVETLELLASLRPIFGSQEMRSLEENIGIPQLPPMLPQSLNDSEKAARNPEREIPQEPRQFGCELRRHQNFHVESSSFSSPDLSTQQRMQTRNEALRCSKYGENALPSRHSVYWSRKQPVALGEYMNNFDWHTHLQMDPSARTGEKPFPCTECTDLKLYKRCHDRGKLCMCPECGKSFRRTHDLAVHKRSHKTKTCCSCLVCGGSFKQVKELRKHQETRCTRKALPCTECAETSLGEVREHRQTHSKSFTERTHTGGKPFPRAECDKCNLTSDERGHTVERPISVNLFGKTDLLDHQKSSLTEKQFSCKECGRRYICKRDLTVHLNIHSQTALMKAAQETSMEDSQNDSFLSIHQNLVTSTAFLQDLIKSTSTFQYD